MNSRRRSQNVVSPPTQNVSNPLGFCHYLSHCGEKKASALIAFRRTGIEAYLHRRILVSEEFVAASQEEEALFSHYCLSTYPPSEYAGFVGLSQLIWDSYVHLQLLYCCGPGIPVTCSGHLKGRKINLFNLAAQHCPSCGLHVILPKHAMPKAH